MTSLVDRIKELVDEGCLVQTIKKSVGRKYCSVDISSEQGKWIVIDLDKQGALIDLQSLRPDFVFISDKPVGRGRIVVVEISMGKNKSANDVRKQIQSGFENLEDRLIRDGSQELIKSIEVTGLFCGNPPKALRQQLANTKVRFGGTVIMIKILNCGQPLSKAFKTS